MNVHINNNNGPDAREIPADEEQLHWYVPLASPASRRADPPPSPVPWLTTMSVAYATSRGNTALVQWLLNRTRASGVLGRAIESLRGVVHTVTGYDSPPLTAWQSLCVLFGAKKSAPALGASMLLQKVNQLTQEDSYITFLLSWRKHSRLISAAAIGITVMAAGMAVWRVVQRWFYNAQPFEPEGLGHPALMCEVTQEAARSSPTHFVCPAGLRAHILEKIFLQERTPAVIQRVKSIAGKWCDERTVNPYERPAFVAGAVAAAMTVSNLELDLLSYERRWQVRNAQHQLAQHHRGDPRVAPQAQSGFWNWLLGPGRR